MPDEPFSEWVRDRPEEVQRLMIDWPPDARVRAKPGVVLMIPAPGVEGRVASWFENGNIGIEAPLAAPAGPNYRGETLPEGEVLRGECSPDQLEIVGYSSYGETEITPDVIRGIVDDDSTTRSNVNTPTGGDDG